MLVLVFGLIASGRQCGKRHRSDVAEFNLELEAHLLQLQEELRTRRYRPDPYHTFFIHEPKKRQISAAPYRDRVVHHALVNVIGPLFERNFIYDSYANRLGKGTHRAVNCFQQYARHYRYVLQGDIVKFFPSLDHEILKQGLRNRIRDEGLRWLCDLIIDHCNPQEPVAAWFEGDDLFTPQERRRGLPIGNQTSQFWANVYLHGLDQFVKRGLRQPYIRYVDDLVIFGNDKAELHRVRRQVEQFLAGLRLTIHPDKTQVRPVRQPSRFLGYRCWPRYRYLTRQNIRLFRRRLRNLQRGYALGRWSWERVKASLQAWCAHAATAHSYHLRWRTMATVRFSRQSTRMGTQ